MPGTQRTYLRPLEQRDLELFSKWVRDEQLRETASLDAFIPLWPGKEIEDLRSAINAKEIIYFTIAGPSAAAIGFFSLHGLNWVHRTAEATTVIGEKSYWGQGIGYGASLEGVEFAFDELNLYRLQGRFLAHHDRMLRLVSKLGFVEEGRLRQAIYKDGRRVDLVVMGLLRDEFYKRKNSQSMKA